MSNGTAKAASPAALTPDICVVGGGAGGIALAMAAAAFGVSVVLVEKGKLGGDSGPLVTRALVEAAAAAQAMREASQLGLKAELPQTSQAELREHIRRVLAADAANCAAERLAALGIRIIRGEARFASRSTVMVDGQPIKARRFVLATGTCPQPPELPGHMTVPVLDMEDLPGLAHLPERPVILGSNATAVAIAQALHCLGGGATLVAQERLLP